MMISTRQSVEHILKTQRGMRVMRPDYGVNWLHYQDRKLSAQQRLALQQEIRSTLEKYEPRAQIDEVLVGASVGAVWRNVSVRFNLSEKVEL